FPQAVGEGDKALFFAVEGGKLRPQVHHIVLQNPLHPSRQAVLQPDYWRGAHGGVEGQGQGTAANGAALVLHHKAVHAPVALGEKIDGQVVLEIDLCRLRGGVLAKAGAPVVGVALQIDGVGKLRQDLGFAGAGEPAHYHQLTVVGEAVEGVQQKAAHGLVAADNPRVGNAALLLQPLLAELGAQAAAETVQV